MSKDDDEELFAIAKGPGKTLSSVEAGKILGVSARQVRRYQEDGTLSKVDRGRLLASEVEDLASQMGLDSAREQETFHTETVLKSYAQAVKHTEQMFQLTMAANVKLHESFQRQLDAASQREELMMSKTMETMVVLGELLTSKHEREVMSAESQARIEMMNSAGKVAVQALPDLLKQFIGGRAQGAMVAPLLAFARSLDDEQRGALALLYWGFEGDQQAAYGGLLKTLGVELPVKPPEDEVVS